jgi:hypothetical protein
MATPSQVFKGTTMTKSVLAGVVLLLSVGASSRAQTPTPTPPPEPSKVNDKAIASFQEASAQQQDQIRARLGQAGFKNIRIQTESFLVRAEDKDGNAVLLIINPDVTSALKLTGAEGSASGTSSTSTVPNKSP